VLWEVGSQGSHDSHGTAHTHDSRGSYRSHRGPPSEAGGAMMAPPSGSPMDMSYRMSAYQSGSRPASQAFDPRMSTLTPMDGPYGSSQEMYMHQSNMMQRPMSTAFSSFGGQQSMILDQSIEMHSGYPSDELILNEIRRILSTADLMTVTKKQVRDELSNVFGVDMSPKKDYINHCIELILQGQL
jgi:chitin synthase